MPNFREVSTNLYGAWRLAQLDRTAMHYFDRSVEGVWRSFWAAAICYPGFLILLGLRLEPEQIADSGLLRILAVETIGYVIGWTLFPLIMLPFCRWLGREEETLGFLTAYNWSQVVQTAFLLAMETVIGGALLPPTLAAFIGLVTYLLVLAYEWFVARIALEVGGVAATAIVLIDLVLGVMLGQIVLGLY